MMRIIVITRILKGFMNNAGTIYIGTIFISIVYVLVMLIDKMIDWII